MSQLGDKQIKDTYPGIIKTSDEGAVGSTPKRLQDGEGNNLPVDVTTAGMRYFGTQDFTNATVTGISGGGGGTSGTSGVNGLPGTSGTDGTSGTSGGGGGGIENYQYYPYTVYTSGYGDTYARTSQPINGGPFWDPAIDQNANTGILSQMFLEAGREITQFINPFLGVTADDTYEVAIYDTYATGSPKDKVFTTTVGVVGVSGDQYVSTAVSFTPTGNRYWIAFQTANSGNSKIGVFSRDAFVNNRFTYGAWGGSPVGMLAVNSLYYNAGDLPATFPDTQEFGHRDEAPVLLYKTAATPI